MIQARFPMVAPWRLFWDPENFSLSGNFAFLTHKIKLRLQLWSVVHLKTNWSDFQSLFNYFINYKTLYCIINRRVFHVIILAEEFAVDRDSCLRRGKQTILCLWPVTDVFQLNWSAVVFCACEAVQLFSVLFCVVRVVHKLDFGLVINETPNKWRPVERRSCSDRDSCLWYDLYVCQRPSSRGLRDSTDAVQVNSILWSKGQYKLLALVKARKGKFDYENPLLLFFPQRDGAPLCGDTLHV
jgi:hypothetical protein